MNSLLSLTDTVMGFLPLLANPGALAIIFGLMVVALSAIVRRLVQRWRTNNSIRYYNSGYRPRS